ncbi:MAG: hypothetical protein DME25_02515 [Verrucomicrobia bacterium]|nr:MAG: hypothetical protein DME25_02515 [Verrucomicrobiota bacterium]
MTEQARNRKQLGAGAGLFLFLLSLHSGSAADAPSTNALAETLLAEGLFAGGRWEATLGSGAMFSPFVANKNRPTINYTLSELQVGYMLSDVKEAGWLRGNVELAGSSFGGAIFEGSGDYIAGGTLWLRYNFVPRDWRVVPYGQAGAGITFTDADRRVVGQTFNFNLDLGVGARYLIDRHWSVALEYRYQHISNANTARKNLGINAQGPIISVSYFF